MMAVETIIVEVLADDDPALHPVAEFQRNMHTLKASFAHLLAPSFQQMIDEFGRFASMTPEEVARLSENALDIGRPVK